MKETPLAYCAAACGLQALLLFGLPYGVQGAERPNLVFILADDLGWSDLSTGRTNLGNPSSYYETPAIERLARGGVSFTNAYTAGANCAPTRAALLTGFYAARPTNNVFGVDHLNRVKQKALLLGPAQGLPSGADAIPKEAVTYAERLSELGYCTAHFGKFHVTDKGVGERDILHHHGFDENHGGGASGSPRRYHAKQGLYGDGVGPELDRFAADYTAEYLQENLAPYSTVAAKGRLSYLDGGAKHLSDSMADAAIDFLGRRDERPFLLQFNTYAVHTPVGDPHARADLLGKYRAKSGQGAHASPSFAALIEGLDQNVARLIHYLETNPDPRSPDQPLSMNTVVLFYSDNGGRLPHSNNGPLRKQKGELHEGGIRVPLIAWSGNPEMVARGVTVAEPVTSVDFFPTLIRLAGGWVKADESDGVDLSPLLSQRHTSLNREAIYWHFPGYLVDRDRNQRPQSVVRSGPWKLIYNYEDQSYELYDLEADISESVDLTAQCPEIAEGLSLLLAEWLRDTQAPLATLRKGAMALTAPGGYYSQGELRRGEALLHLQAGQEVPLVLFSR